MKTRNIFAILTAAIIYIFFATVTSSAQVVEKPPHMPGITEGTGRHFEITDSEYLNFFLESSEEISVRIESAPEMIVLNIKASSETQSSNFILSGLPANITYHKYQDGYHNYAPLIIDENGAVRFDQDISQNHTIFIQPRKSTKSIYGSVGGDCESIGDWNASSKTCILDQDVSGSINVYTDGITLDGNGHTVSGSVSSTGIYIEGKNMTVKNITITGFYHGIYISAKNSKIISVTAKNNRIGIALNYANNNIVSGNTMADNYYLGLILYYSANNIVSGNILGPGNAYGIQQAYSGSYNVYENNDISNNSNTGMISYGGTYYITMRNNTVKSNAYDGIILGGDHHILSGNVMSGNGFGAFNGKSNFHIAGGDMSTNNIDQSNTVEGKPIYYLKNEANKIYDSSFNIGSFYCMNCENITLKNLALPEHVAKIFFWHTNNSLIEGVNSPDKSAMIDLWYSSGNVVKNNDLGKIYAQYSSNSNQIYNNNFSDAYFPAYLDHSSGNLFNLNSPIGGNHWKKYETTCQDADNNGFCDLPFTFSLNGKDNLPRVREFNHNSVNSCCSSVMFLPGHQASRLYRKGSDGDEDQLWEPTNHNQDVMQLYMNSDGESIDPGIYTREVMDNVYGIKDIYGGFIDSMDSFVGEGIINEWKPIPYDWRLSLGKIIDDGVKLENGGHMDIVDEVKRMADASKTGKITLIGHSNGGLLAKTLIDKLKETGDEKLVDKLIMVGTPQLGTPKAIASLLHGDNANMLLGLTLNNETGRGFAENMESAYNLLPSKKYFDTVQSPVVEFDDDVKDIYDFRSFYGDNIDNWDEFKKFLTGDDGGRLYPEFGDTDSPNVLRETLLNKSAEAHDELDNWQAPEGMEVVQIAGWGLDTIRGIKYDDCDIPFCPDKLSNLDRSLIFTQDGDETVVVPSAVGMGGEAERYYFNLNRYNRFLGFNVDRAHADILEADILQNFIENIIQDNRTLTDYISINKPEAKGEDKRLRFTLHSPVKLDIYDQDGNHTGLVPVGDSGLAIPEEQIPNSYYTEFGETKYAGSGDFPVNVVLTGEDLGTFTFNIDQVAGDKTANTTTFANVPVMKDMLATLTIAENVSAMQIDVEGDGQNDFMLQVGEKIKPENLLEILGKIIHNLNIEPTIKDRLSNKIDNAKKQMKIRHTISANAMLENVKQQIRNFSDDHTQEKFHIPEDEAEKLIGIINRIKMSE